MDKEVAEARERLKARFGGKTQMGAKGKSVFVAVFHIALFSQF